MSKIAPKSPIFPHPVYLTPPMKGLPLEFGIGVRGPECFYDGAIRWSITFSDTFSRFDTIPAVTDSQPPSNPASHVAVAITLNAKASSLKRVLRLPVTENCIFIHQRAAPAINNTSPSLILKGGNVGNNNDD